MTHTEHVIDQIRDSGNLAQYVILIEGDILLHRKPFPKSFPLANRITLVRCSETDTVSECKRLNPSLLVARQSLIEQWPARVFAELTNYGRGTYVLAILEADRTEAASRMLQIGCRGVLPFGFAPKLFRQAVLKILQGEIWAQNRLVANLLSDLLRLNAAKQSELTNQEHRIFDLIVQGYKNSAIADALSISPETVRWHARRLYRKIGRLDRPRNLHAATHRQAAAG